MPDENQSEENSIEQLQKDLETVTNSWKRALADFENYKRRKEAENKELLEFAKEVTVVKLLPTIDALEQALRHLPVYVSGVVRPFMGNQETDLAKADKSADYSSDGFAAKYQNWQTASSFPPPPLGEDARRAGEGDKFVKNYANWQIGVQGIIAQLDKALEELGVNKIEAIGKKFDPHFHEAVREVEGDADHIVVEELQSGFELNGKVIRPSQVTISKKAAKGGE